MLGPEVSSSPTFLVADASYPTELIVDRQQPYFCFSPEFFRHRTVEWYDRKLV